MLQPLAQLGAVRCRAEPWLQAGDVELGRREQRAELVVQLAREPALLVLAHRLHVLQKIAQLPRARVDLALQRIALGLQRQALLLALAEQGAGLAHEQIKPEHAHCGERADAQAVEQQRAADAGALGLDGLQLLVDQRAGEFVHAVHLALAHAAGHLALARQFAALRAQPHQCLQLRHALVRQVCQLARLPQPQRSLLRVVVEDLPLRRTHLAHRVAVGLQVFGAAGDQVTALARLGVAELLLQPLDGQPPVGHAVHFAERGDRLTIGHFADDQKRRGEQQRGGIGQWAVDDAEDGRTHAVCYVFHIHGQSGDQP